jgi:hypothetical protein
MEPDGWLPHSQGPATCLYNHVYIPVKIKYSVLECLLRVFLTLFRRIIQIAKSIFGFVIMSVRMEQLGCYWTDFHEIWCLTIFRKPVGKIQVSLKSDMNNGTSHEHLCTFMITSRLIFSEWEMFQTKF